MIWPVVVAWIHYVAVMLLIASLLGEHLQLKQALTATRKPGPCNAWISSMAVRPRWFW